MIYDQTRISCEIHYHLENLMTDQTFDIAGGSDVGRKRSENQDHYLIAKLRRQLVICDSDVPYEDCDAIYGCPEGRLLVVADGMGGHHDGERASRTAVMECARYVLDMMQWFLKLSADDEDDFTDELGNSLRRVQEKIWSQGTAATHKMGTTVTMAYVLWPKMYVVHAGDSRCYLLRDGKLRQVTTDHTIAQQLVDTGALTEEAANQSHWRHVLWNCVGGGDRRVEPEVVRCQLQEGDVVLLCSDGLTGMLDDEHLKRQLSKCDQSESAVKQLIDAANEKGGTDNISVIVNRVLRSPSCEDAMSDDEPIGINTTIIE